MDSKPSNETASTTIGCQVATFDRAAEISSCHCPRSSGPLQDSLMRIDCDNRTNRLEGRPNYRFLTLLETSKFPPHKPQIPIKDASALARIQLLEY